ncbi:unnamed protein product [Polarella glacialis]|uniref:Uncharacterized protein n=1 Tax=Polarella glacialis TaxID=89957 RepID=A0A813KRS8_POLGL|nr:unnamed protein product [Polarella glacialis]
MGNAAAVSSLQAEQSTGLTLEGSLKHGIETVSTSFESMSLGLESMSSWGNSSLGNSMSSLSSLSTTDSRCCAPVVVGSCEPRRLKEMCGGGSQREGCPSGCSPDLLTAYPLAGESDFPHDLMRPMTTELFEREEEIHGTTITSATEDMQPFYKDKDEALLLVEVELLLLLFLAEFLLTGSPKRRWTLFAVSYSVLLKSLRSVLHLPPPADSKLVKTWQVASTYYGVATTATTSTTPATPTTPLHT